MTQHWESIRLASLCDCRVHLGGGALGVGRGKGGADRALSKEGSVPSSLWWIFHFLLHGLGVGER